MDLSDQLNVVADLGARVGTDHTNWRVVLGRHGTGSSNSNGLLFLQTRTKRNRLLTSTVFHHPMREKATWMHPRSRHWHLLDNVLSRKRNQCDLHVIIVMCRADAWTDHRLVISELVNVGRVKLFGMSMVVMATMMMVMVASATETGTIAAEEEKEEEMEEAAETENNSK
ncbi:hypothetical protein SprV_0100195100 [Sparganum proliferum]